MEFVSVFDEASRDFESEDREHRLTAATVEAQALWPFLALAQSEEEFGHRLALREPALSAIAVKHGVPLEDVTGPLERGFEALHTEAKVKCRRCNHDNTPHTQGAVCPCGCTTFQPKTASVYDSPENHQCENDGNGRCKHCAQDIPKDLQGKTGSYDDPPSDAEVANYGQVHGDNIEDHYGPSYDPEVVHELPLHGTKSNPVYFYNEGYHHGHAGVEYKGYGGRDAAILYGTGYRHGKADRVVTKPEFDPHRGSWQGHLANLHQALMDGQDPLTWIQQQNPPGGPQYAEEPSGHDEVEHFDISPWSAGRNARDQALENAGTGTTPTKHDTSPKTSHRTEGSLPF